MSVASYVLGIVAALAVLGLVIEMLRRRRLRERHAVWWLIAGAFALIVSVFPALLVSAAAILGIEIPTNLVFFVSLIVLFLVCIQHAAELTKLEDKVRVLAEESALTEFKLMELTRHIHQQPQETDD